MRYESLQGFTGNVFTNSAIAFYTDRHLVQRNYRRCIAVSYFFLGADEEKEERDKVLS